jgi:SAM-dependent methyltransferase
MQLEPTSERLIVEHYQHSAEDYLIYLFHIATYNFAKPYIDGKRVLDFGCGSGYGTAWVAGACAKIVGVDIAPEAISYAQEHYQRANLTYTLVKPVDIEPLPFLSGTFDTILSFQVIEHIRNVSPYLAEIVRVLKPGGFLLIATPDRTSRLFRFQKPWNRWHVKEYDRNGLCRILMSSFRTVDIFEMGGRKAVLATELTRTRKLKWLSLPFTFPGMPEGVRISCLSILKSWLSQTTNKRSSPPPRFDFDESALVIAPTVENSVNLIAVAQKG